MTGVDATCWINSSGKATVFPVNGLVWQMLRLSTTGVSLRSSDLKYFAMDQRIAPCIRWEDLVRYHKGLWQLLR